MVIVVAERGIGVSLLLEVVGVAGVNEEVVSLEEEESLGNMPWPIVNAGVFMLKMLLRIEKVGKQ